MNYYIIVKTGWIFAAQEFSAQLRERWPMIRIEELQDPSDSDILEFELPMEKSKIHGSLNREGSAIIFIGGFQDCSRFAQWCRSLIPPAEKVIFCDESMSINFVLELSMTPEEIAQAARSSEQS